MTLHWLTARLHARRERRRSRTRQALETARAGYQHAVDTRGHVQVWFARNVIVLIEQALKEAE